ncbi:MAG: VOC family protein [Candidatus Levyibacteriota bacterium]
MLNFNSVLLFSENPKDLAAFYEKVFQTKPGWTNGDYTGFQVGASHFMVGPHDKVKGKSQMPERVLFNFETEDVEKEFERIKELGATVVAEPYHPGEDPKGTIATLADLDGNYFQLVTPMKM